MSKHVEPITDLWLPEFLAQKTSGIPWLIEPYLPLGGVVFMHGPTSAGKSPLTWRLAASVSEGIDFFGYKVSQTGPVLYVELDTPANLIHPRLAKLDIVPKKMFLATFPKPLNSLNFSPEDAVRLTELHSKVNPKLVIVNTLRKAHQSDDKEGHVPSQVYGAWQNIYPGATILFVHHDKKAPAHNEDYNPDESFSGNKAWQNDAQVALKVSRLGNVEHGDEEEEHKKTKISLRMTKSQVSDCELYPALVLQLDTDGTNWLETGPEAYRKYFITLDLKLSRSDRIQKTMLKFGMGKTAIYNAVKGLE